MINGQVLHSRKLGLDIYTAVIVIGGAVSEYATFMSEQAARMWLARKGVTL